MAIKAIIDAVQHNTSSASHAEQRIVPYNHRPLRSSRIDENGNTNRPKILLIYKNENNN
jgi:hypothetical protein